MLARRGVILWRVAVDASPGDGVVVTNSKGKGRVTLVDVAITNSAGNGVAFDRRATIIRSQVSDNGQHGVVVRNDGVNDCARGRISARASLFMNNGRDGDCGSAEVCADVATCSAREAQLSDSTCARSRQLGSGMPGSTCGVCEFD